MTTITLNAKQVEVLASLKIDPQYLVFVSGQKFHRDMNGTDALTDGYYLVLVEGQTARSERFSRYLKWESKMNLEVESAGLTIYSNADERINDCVIGNVFVEFPAQVK